MNPARLATSSSRRVARRRAVWLGLLVGLGIFPDTLWAHDPLDCSSKVTVGDDGIRLAITMGLDGVREILSQAGFSEKSIRETVAARGPHSSSELPVTLASRLFDVKCDGEVMAARRVSGTSDGAEVIFFVEYPRPASGTLELRAAYFGAVRQMRPGWLVGSDGDGNNLLTATLSATESVARLELPRAKSAGAATSAIQPATALQPTAVETAAVPGIQDRADRAVGQSNLPLRWLALLAILIASVWIGFRLCRMRKVPNVF